MGHVEVDRRDRDVALVDGREVRPFAGVGQFAERADPDDRARRAGRCARPGRRRSCASPARATFQPLTSSGARSGKLMLISTSSGQPAASSRRIRSGAQRSAVAQRICLRSAACCERAIAGTLNRVASMAAGDRARIGHVLGQVAAVVDAREHQVDRPVLDDAAASPSSTQSVGVPSTAKRRSPSRRTRKRPAQRQRVPGAALVRLRRHDPDVVAELARRCAPAPRGRSALMPSSLVTRMRIGRSAHRRCSRSRPPM